MLLNTLSHFVKERAILYNYNISKPEMIEFHVVDYQLI